MFCNKCGNKLNDGHQFCNKCGTEVSIKEQNKENQNKECKNPTVKKMLEHLEFLGYTTSLLEFDRDFVLATNQNRNNLIIRDLLDGYIMLSVRLRTKLKEQNNEANLIINETNKINFLSRCFIEIDKEDEILILNFEAIFIGEYDKERFSTFIELLDKDVLNIRNVNNFDKVFL